MIVREIGEGKIYFTVPWALVTISVNDNGLTKEEAVKSGNAVDPESDVYTPQEYVCARFTCYEQSQGSFALAIRLNSDGKVSYDKSQVKDGKVMETTTLIGSRFPAQEEKLI